MNSFCFKEKIITYKEVNNNEIQYLTSVAYSAFVNFNLLQQRDAR